MENKAGVAMNGNIVFLWPGCITTSCSFGCLTDSRVCSAAPLMFARGLDCLLSLLPLCVAALPAQEVTGRLWRVTEGLWLHGLKPEHLETDCSWFPPSHRASSLMCPPGKLPKLTVR